MLTSFLGIDGAVKGVTDAVGKAEDVLLKYIPDGTVRAQASAEIDKAMAESVTARVNAQRDVMMADAHSDNWFTRAARPMVVYWSLTGITAIAVLGYMGKADPVAHALALVPDRMWDMVAAGIGIYTVARTAEKTVKSTVSTIATAIRDIKSKL
jgi:hypothetical protein